MDGQNMNDKSGPGMHDDMHWKHWHHGYGRFWVLRIFVMLFLLLFVFWLGVKVGEIKQFYRGEYGGYYRTEGPKGFMMWGPGPGMMGGYPNVYFYSTTTPPVTK